MRFVAKMLVLSRNVKCDREMRFQIFLLQKYLCEFVLVIMLDHFIVYVRLSDSNFFEMTNALTKAIHQTWRKRLIKLDTSDISSSLISNISSNLTKCISSNLIKLDIKSDNCVSSNSDERYLIKLDDILSNSTRILFVLSDERFWVTSEEIE
jgi:6-phosphogluconolactonase/glucosamine-6-phosphate isomerase/deaminase